MFAAALYDSGDSFLGANLMKDLPGELGLPEDVRFRDADLHTYLTLEVDETKHRRFPLVSATWIRVRGRRVRLGVYVENVERAQSWEALHLELSAVNAVLEAQMERRG